MMQITMHHILNTLQMKTLFMMVPFLPLFFIDLVTKAHSVDDGEFEANITLLEFVGVGLKRNSRLVVLSWLALKLGVEQRVHQGGFTQACLAYRGRSTTRGYVEYYKPGSKVRRR